MVGEEVKFYAPDKENLEFLESKGLTYNEMSKYFITNQSRKNIAKYFKKFGIHHRTKTERIIELIKEDPFRTTNSIAIRLGVSPRMVNLVKSEMPRITYIKYWYEKDRFFCVLKGHAGRDIVCAALSTLSLFAVNFMSDYSHVDSEEGDGYLKYAFVVDCEGIQIFVNSLVEHYEALQRQYPKYVKIMV